MSGRELDAHAASPAEPYPRLPALRGGVVERASLEVVAVPGDRVGLQVVDARGRVVEALELEPGVAADLAAELAKNAKEAAPGNRKLEYEALERALEEEEDNGLPAKDDGTDHRVDPMIRSPRNYDYRRQAPGTSGTWLTGCWPTSLTQVRGNSCQQPFRARALGLLRALRRNICQQIFPWRRWPLGGSVP
jgi:hypothetical protein